MFTLPPAHGAAPAPGCLGSAAAAPLTITFCAQPPHTNEARSDMQLEFATVTTLLRLTCAWCGARAKVSW
jgi:hypothetical protein